MLGTAGLVLERFREVIAPHLPKAYREGTMTWVFVISIAVIMALIPSSFLDMEIYGNAPGLVAVPTLMILLFAVNYGMTLKTGVNVFLLISSLTVLYCSSQIAGIHSPRNVWLLLIPMAPFYFQGARVGWMWSAWVAVMFLILAYMTHFQGWAEVMPLAEGLMVSSWAALSWVAMLALVIPLVYQVSSESVLQDKEEQMRVLTVQRDELEQSQAERDRFIAGVSHELRTPMNAILGLNGWLLEQVKDNPQALRLLQQTRQSADHLMTVINDVLDYSQLQSGEIVLHRSLTSLPRCAEDAFSVLAQQAHSKGLDYQLERSADLPEWVEVDRHRLVQVLVNLLGNAVKFTSVGSVRLKLGKSPQGIHFEVTDTGIGISPQQMAVLFQRYGQADPTIHERFGGTGLGLVISRSLVNWMGGTLEVSSEPGQGSRFHFTLPLTAARPVSPETPQPMELKSASRSWRFLVVDDHAVNRLLVNRRLMTTWPLAEVVELTDGAQAVEWLSTHSCDVVFMDMLMPVMDGIEATRRIRQLSLPQGNAALIGLTANVNAEDLRRFQEAGLDGLHLKPYDWALLCQEVDRLLIMRLAQA